MKLVLLHPPKFNQVWAGVPDVFNDKKAYVWPPMGIMYLTSYLRQNSSHDVTYLDAVPYDWSYEQTVREVLKHDPDVVGVTATTHNVLNAAIMFRLLKEAAPKVTRIFGGPHIAAFPDEALAWPEVDYAFQGDAEQSLLQFLDAMQAGDSPTDIPGMHWREDGEHKRSHPYEPIEDLDFFPFPDRHAVPHHLYYTPSNIKKYSTTIFGSRGCPNHCVFCTVPHNFRARTPENIVDEMAYCKDVLGVEDFHFSDDLFNYSEERVIAISEEILRRNLKVLWGFKASCKAVSPEMLRIARRAGCYRMHWGVETGTDEGLKALNKTLTTDRIIEVFNWSRAAKIRNIAYMMVGCPHEKTRDQIFDTARFVRKLKPDYVVYALFTPYADAPIFNEGVELGLWKGDEWLNFIRDPQLGYQLPTAWTQYFTEPELFQIFKELHRQFYMNPLVIARTLMTVNNPTHLLRILRGGLQILKLETIRSGSRRL